MNTLGSHGSAKNQNSAPGTAPPPWHLIPSREAAKILNVSLQVLANWRIRDNGPPHTGLVRGKGNKVFYRRADVLAWAAKQRGEPVEPWEISRDWLAGKGLSLETPSPEGIAWLAAQYDRVFR